MGLRIEDWGLQIADCRLLIGHYRASKIANRQLAIENDWRLADVFSH